MINLIRFKFWETATLVIFFQLLFFTINIEAQPGLNLTPRPIVLKGTIVSSSGIIPGGYIVIENHKISRISPSMPRNEMPVNSIYVDTKGIIFPGLIDLHNHVTWNVFPQWNIGKQKFSNRYEWRYHNLTYQKKIVDPNDAMLYNGVSFFCQMNTYGELRALVGGTTSILNTSDDDNECIHGLVRNLDDPTQLDDQQIEYYIDIQNHNPDKPENDQKIINELNVIKQKLIAGSLDAFLIHLAEGKANDFITKQEFNTLQSKGMLTNKTAIIHGIALGPNEFHAMYNAGSSLIWSPRSNIELYGETADILQARNAGVRIALAPDWAITGSKNMLDELHFAADWNREHLNNLFSNKELVEMVTSIPAAIAGVDQKIGMIREGYYADLLVISAGAQEPYSTLVSSGTKDVRLVFINGSPIYGTKDLMERFWNIRELEQLLNSSPPMMLKLPNSSKETFGELQRTLKLKMLEEGTELAPIFNSREPHAVIPKSKISIYNGPGIKGKKQ